jgi:hypothetical protein
MRIRTGFALCLLLALGVAGCGGPDKDDGVATAGSPGSNATSSAGADGLSEQERALKFAQCMRDNGVPNFPDPKTGDGGGMSIDIPEGADAKKVDAAMQTCKRYLPNGGEPQKMDPQQLEQLRKFAQCMRDNGIKNFPDPTDQGIQINGNTSGIDPNDPKVQAAQKACDKYAPAPRSGEPGPGTQTGGNG